MKYPIKNVIMMILIALVASAIIIIWWSWFHKEPLPEGLIQANGRIEGDHYTVASKFSGKIVERLVNEGDEVIAGQVMVRLDCLQVNARVEQALANMEAVEAQLEVGKTQLRILNKQVPLQVDTAQSGVEHALAALSLAKASEEQASKDAKRFDKLFKNHTVDKHRSEQVNLAWKVTQANTATTIAALTQARKHLAETKLGKEKIEAKEQELHVLEFQLKLAQSTLTEIQSIRDDLTILAPAKGMITTRLVDVGEVVTAGSPLFDIVDLDRLYLKVYIPEKVIGKVRLGLSARIYIDAFPDQPFTATVRYIASQAEFTPKEVQTPDERVKLVYAVKLYLNDNPDHRLSPGLPADTVIRWQEGVEWVNPSW